MRREYHTTTNPCEIRKNPFLIPAVKNAGYMLKNGWRNPQNKYVNSGQIDHPPRKFCMEPRKRWFPNEISYCRVPFSGEPHGKVTHPTTQAKPSALEHLCKARTEASLPRLSTVLWGNLREEAFKESWDIIVGYPP